MKNRSELNEFSAESSSDEDASSTTTGSTALPDNSSASSSSDNSLFEKTTAVSNDEVALPGPPKSQDILSSIKWYFNRQLLPVLSDLRLAIVLLLSIAVFSILGTVIEQGQTLSFYQENYPEDPALYGFLSWKILLLIGLDHVYRTWWFLSLLVLFGSSLAACTFTRQLPALKSARRWSFYKRPSRFQRLALSAELPSGNLETIAEYLGQKRYRIFQQENVLYARKGIVGRIGPILVHISMLIVLAGSIWGAMTGFFAQEMITSGQVAPIQHILDAGPWSSPQIPKDWAVQVNRFWIDYDPSGRVDQFYSDLSIVDGMGKELDQDVIYVNHPLKYHGVTLYQTDWAVAAVRVHVNNSPVLQLPMAALETGGQGRLWGTWLPTKPDMSAGVAVVAKDMQGTILIYGTDGNLIDILREGASTQVGEVVVGLDEVVGSTGLQIKADPGIPFVYTGFGLLMIGVVMSYVSHSQVWALRTSDKLLVGGRTNRAQVTFERELIELVNILEGQSSQTSLSNIALALDAAEPKVG
ncbi:MAG: cytochrome c biogenesis protein [Cyanobacteria bacterium P01_F01_bin.150]